MEQDLAGTRVMLYEAPGGLNGEGSLALIREGDDRAVVGLEDVAFSLDHRFLDAAAELAFYAGHPDDDYLRDRYWTEHVVTDVPAAVSEDGKGLKWCYSENGSEETGRLVAIYEHEYGLARVVGEPGGAAREYLGEMDPKDVPPEFRGGGRHDDNLGERHNAR